MKKLELLGLQADGESLTLNDADGNRYHLDITDDLRAALRKDKAQSVSDGQTERITPREIQAYVREGKSIEEISELAFLPLSRVEALAHPIMNERTYNARLACTFPTARERGAMTLEELVATRLATRGVDSSSITWDSIRIQGQPWTLIARYRVGESDYRASWHVDLTAHTFSALDDEAVWLSETPLLSQSDTWRPPHTPAVDVSDVPSIRSAKSAASAPSSSSPSASSPSHIDAVLASLDSRRGQASAMPVPVPSAPSAGSSETAAVISLYAHSTPEPLSEATLPTQENTKPEATQETIFDLPVASDVPPVQQSASAASPEKPTGDVSGQAHHDAKKESAPLQKKIKKSSRASVPTWDEIVFGKKTD